MPSIVFDCDFDNQNNRWWFQNQENDDKYYLSGYIVPNDWDCHKAAKKLVDSMFPFVYPLFTVYEIKTNSNCQVYDNETQRFYPSNRFTVLINYIDHATGMKPEDVKHIYDEDEDDDDDDIPPVVDPNDN